MFTGIVESVGTVTSVEDGGATARLTIASPGLGDDLVRGESVAVDGVCLTVAHIDADTWVADVMRITVQTSTLARLTAGSRVNLERAMPAAGRLGGHIMQGHVDGVATLVSRDSQPQWDDLTFSVPQDMLRYVVAKGSIALNGVSLTIAELAEDRVTVSLIPTTLAETTFGDSVVGDEANVEVDVIAKYVERMMGVRS